MVSHLFETFIREKQYLGGLSPRTLSSYNDVYKRWIRFVGDEMPHKANLTEFVIKMVEADFSPATINITVRSWNVFLSWLFQNDHTEEYFKMQKVKEPKRMMRAVPEVDMQKFLLWKPHPNDRVEIRLYAFLCTLADTGMRIDEVLTVEIPSIYWDDYLMFVIGKGRRERYVPMSVELRKILYQYVYKQRQTNVPSELLFCSINGTKLSYHNMYRDVKALMERLDIDARNFDGFFHAWRRFYAKQFLKEGGNTIYLQRALGHSNIATTRMYVEVEEEDLVKVHKRASFLAKMKKLLKR